MKRYLIVFLTIITAVLAAGCSKQSATQTEPAAEPSTQLHTIPPTETGMQPEWAPVDCEITLESSDSVYAEGSDFQTFALVGNSDETCALHFILDDVTAAMLSQQDAGISYYVTVNGKVLKSEVTFNSDFTELTLKGGYTYSEMCALATEIRGL